MKTLSTSKIETVFLRMFMIIFRYATNNNKKFRQNIIDLLKKKSSHFNIFVNKSYDDLIGNSCDSYSFLRSTQNHRDLILNT